MRQSLRHRGRNLERKKALRRLVKQLRKAIAGGDKGQIQQLMPQLMKAADKAAQRNVIHANRASRIKSRFAKRAQAVS